MRFLPLLWNGVDAFPAPRLEQLRPLQGTADGSYARARFAYGGCRCFVEYAVLPGATLVRIALENGQAHPVSLHLLACLAGPCRLQGEGLSWGERGQFWSESPCRWRVADSATELLLSGHAQAGSWGAAWLQPTLAPEDAAEFHFCWSAEGRPLAFGRPFETAMAAAVRAAEEAGSPHREGQALLAWCGGCSDLEERQPLDAWQAGFAARAALQELGPATGLEWLLRSIHPGLDGSLSRVPTAAAAATAWSPWPRSVLQRCLLNHSWWWTRPTEERDGWLAAHTLDLLVLATERGARELMPLLCERWADLADRPFDLNESRLERILPWLASYHFEQGSEVGLERWTQSRARARMVCAWSRETLKGQLQRLLDPAQFLCAYGLQQHGRVDLCLLDFFCRALDRLHLFYANTLKFEVGGRSLNLRGVADELRRRGLALLELQGGGSRFREFYSAADGQGEGRENWVPSTVALCWHSQGGTAPLRRARAKAGAS